MKISAMDPSDRKRFNAALPDLVKQVDPVEMLPFLSCLSDMGRQQIVNRQRQDSAHAAMLLLHEHLGRRDQGFKEFVYGLRQMELNDLADRLTGELDTGKRQDHTSRKAFLSSRQNEPKTVNSSKSNEPKQKPVVRHKKTNNHGTFVRDLNAGVRKILKQLDYSGGQKWQDLAGHLGYSFSDCKKIENDASISKESPTLVLITQCSDLTLGDLLTILRSDMERIDVADALEKFTGYKLPLIDGESEQDAMQPMMNEEKLGPVRNPENESLVKNKECSVKQASSLNSDLYHGQHNTIPEVDSKVLYDRNSRQYHREKSNNLPDLNRNTLSVNLEKDIHDRSNGEKYQTLNYNPSNLPKPMKKRQTIMEIARPSDSPFNRDQVFETEVPQNALGTNLNPNCSASFSHDNQQMYSDSTSQFADIDKPFNAEGSTASAYTETVGEMIEIPINGGVPRLVKRVQFHQQDSELPGPYEPVTASTPVLVDLPATHVPVTAETQVLDDFHDSDVSGEDVPGNTLYGLKHTGAPVCLSTNKVLPGLVAEPSDVYVHPSNENHVSNRSDSMLISVGEPLSVHHYDTQSPSDEFADIDNESIFSSNEEKAEIQRKAFKSLPKSMNIGSTAGVDSLENTKDIRNAESDCTSDLESYELSNSIIMSDTTKEQSTPAQLISQPASELYVRRRTANNRQASSTVSDGVIHSENENIITQVQESQLSSRKLNVVSGEVSSDEQCLALQEAANTANIQNDENAFRKVHEEEDNASGLSVPRGELSLDNGSVAMHEITHGTACEDEYMPHLDQYPDAVRGEVQTNPDTSTMEETLSGCEGENTAVGEHKDFPWRSMFAFGSAAIAATVVFRSLKS